MAGKAIPQNLRLFAIAMVLGAFGLIAHFEIIEYVKLMKFSKLNRRLQQAPNVDKVWWSTDIFFDRPTLRLLAIGKLLNRTHNWTEMCYHDSNRDGITNGQHLGDPCCRWKPNHDSFSLKNNLEYRRWHLSHPSETLADVEKHRLKQPRLRDRPVDCDKPYDPVMYRQQFEDFYFHDGHYEDEPKTWDAESILKFLCLLGIVGVAVDWSMRKQLLSDAFPFISSQSLPWYVSPICCVVSFIYMDLTSGVIHLVLDYAPTTIPGLGILAKGFQYHHHDPTAIIRITWYDYVSHIHVLFPVILLALFASDASRLQRLFWAWGGIWAHLFQTAHRWAHFPINRLPWYAQFLQSTGLVLTHHRHMQHHQDLNSQFTILSGHTDAILDNLSFIVTPHRYDVWLLFGVFWFLAPIFSDVLFRDAIERMIRPKGGHMVEPVGSLDCASSARINVDSNEVELSLRHRLAVP